MARKSVIKTKIKIGELIKKFECDSKLEERTVDWEGVDLRIKPVLSMEETVLFVNTVVEKCFDTQGEYMPWIKQIITDSLMITLYTNVELFDKYEEVNKLIWTTNIIEVILNNINLQQFGVITGVIDELIEYKTNTNIDAVRNAAKEVGEMSTKMFDAFGDINKDQFKNMVYNLSGKMIDEGKLVEAISNATFGTTIGGNTNE